jgi:hypothetical protein
MTIYERSYSGNSPRMKLSQIDLLEISQEISKSYAAKISDSTPKLTLMPVAPKHLYAYWNLGNNKRAPLHENTPKPLTLRVYSASDKNNYLSKGYEDIPISDTQSQQDIFLSTPTNGSSYRASFGICFSDNHLEVLADSNLTQLPQEKTPINQVKSDSPALLTSINKGVKSSGYNNGSGQGVK